MAGPKKSDETVVVSRTEVEKKIERPKLYKVLLHNDDYTTREFVVWILQSIFRRGESEALQIMLHVHKNGVGVAGLYPRDIAEAKVSQVTHLAEKNEFPLLTTMEPEE